MKHRSRKGALNIKGWFDQVGTIAFEVDEMLTRAKILSQTYPIKKVGF
jgi:hypothetical protein